MSASRPTTGRLRRAARAAVNDPNQRPPFTARFRPWWVVIDWQGGPADGAETFVAAYFRAGRARRRRDREQMRSRVIVAAGGRFRVRPAGPLRTVEGPR